MSMDAFLAEYYGTNKTASAPAEDLEKQATVDLFMKLAAEQNIDLRSMKDADVQQLYSNFVGELNKTAAAAPPAPAAPQAKTASEEEEEKKKKEEEAKKEHAEKHAMAKKADEADAMGRIMAHAYVQELRKIAADTKLAELPPQFLAHAKGKDDGDKDDKGKHEPPPFAKKDGDKDDKKDEKEEKKASGSHFDDLAHAAAIKMAQEANFDPKEADQKVAAVRVLGLAPDTTKTASAPYEAAIGIRALEFLEKAGYPVTWNEQK